MRDGRDKVPGAGPLRRLWMGITLAVAAQAAITESALAGRDEIWSPPR